MKFCERAENISCVKNEVLSLTHIERELPIGMPLYFHLSVEESRTSYISKS